MPDSPLCAVCEPNWIADNEFMCSPCPPAGETWLRMAAIVGGALVGVLILMVLKRCVGDRAWGNWWCGCGAREAGGGGGLPFHARCLWGSALCGAARCSVRGVGAARCSVRGVCCAVHSVRHVVRSGAGAFAATSRLLTTRSGSTRATSRTSASTLDARRVGLLAPFDSIPFDSIRSTPCSSRVRRHMPTPSAISCRASSVFSPASPTAPKPNGRRRSSSPVPEAETRQLQL